MPSSLFHSLPVLVLVVGLIVQDAPCQEVDRDVGELLNGVKFAFISTQTDWFEQPTETKRFFSELLGGIGQGFERLGIRYVVNDSPAARLAMNNTDSQCDWVFVSAGWDLNTRRTDVTHLLLVLSGCSSDLGVYELKSDEKISAFKRNIWNNVYELRSDFDARVSTVVRKLLPASYAYDLDARARLGPVETFDLKSQGDFVELFDSAGTDGVEGVYERFSSERYEAKYKFGIVRSLQRSGQYDAVYLDGADNNADWSPGELKARLFRTGTPGLFRVTWIMSNKVLNEDVYASFDTNGLLTFRFDDNETRYLRLYPLSDGVDGFGGTHSTASSASGSGVLLPGSNYVVTNWHVVQDATNIDIQFPSTGKTYAGAKTVIADRNNDLAILELVPSPTDKVSLPTTEFGIRGDLVDVGEEVFVLGYPLVSAMGDNIKVTDGIVSSNTGYKNDPATYQISAPIQPGNSGGPLFDRSGNMIGIVNAKLRGAENAGYAIKASYVINLLDLLPGSTIKFARSNTASRRALPKLVEDLSPSVVLITVGF